MISRRTTLLRMRRQVVFTSQVLMVMLLAIITISKLLFGSGETITPHDAEVQHCSITQQDRINIKWPFLPDGQNYSHDPRLIEHIRTNVLVQPSSVHQAYNLSKPDVKNIYPGQIISKMIRVMSEGVEQGTFFEAGALDGEEDSTTLYLEKEHGWTGLLVEMTPINHQLIINKHRRAYFAPVCLSPDPWPIQREMKVIYHPRKVQTRQRGSISKRRHGELPAGYESDIRQLISYSAIVDCYPLYSLLAAANLTQIDFMSLDLEGVELQVLKTLPWDLVDIKVLYMDLRHTEEGPAATRDFMISKGYVHVSGEWEPVIFAKDGWEELLSLD